MFADSNAPLTPLSALGEFGLIDRLTSGFSISSAVEVGIGDDAAVMDVLPGEKEVISTDLLLEGIHFDLTYVPLQHLGYKAIAVNVSDIVAMNAEPVAVTVSIAMSNRFTVEAMEAFYEGVRLACERYEVSLIGGDTSSSKQGLIISVTAIGRVTEKNMILRSGGKPRELVCVTGDLGSAYAGLLILEREKITYSKNPDWQPDLQAYDYVVGRQLKPEARLGLMRKFQDMGLRPSSMMDVSDGLASEIHHLCRHNGCGATLFASKLPLDEQTGKVAAEFQISPVTFALNGGEDYELIFTLPLDQFDKLADLPEVSVIGHLTEDPQVIQIILESGQAVDIEAQGWQHFPKSEEA